MDPVADSRDINSVWQAVRKQLHEQLSDAVFNIWLDPLEPVAIKSNKLFISAPESIRLWTQERFGSVLKATLLKVTGHSIDIVLIDSADVKAIESDMRENRLPLSQGNRRPINPRYTFDQFVIGKNNHFAHASCLAVAELPAQAYNPLFIASPTGLGKTHLLQSIANYVQSYAPTLKVVYTTIEGFTNEFVKSLRGGDLDNFKHHYRGTDILLIDDIQFLQGKEQTQEEFFHTFNALYQLGSQIVVTSDRPPQKLSLLHERMQSRFELGLIVDIEKPDYETRLAILKKRAHFDDIVIDDPEVLEHIALRINSNVRSLEGALIRSIAYASLKREPLSCHLVDQVVTNLYPQLSTGRPTVKSVKEAVCHQFKLSEYDLCSKSRSADLTYPRHLAMYLARELTGLSLPKIAGHFNRQDHTTILSATTKISKLVHNDPKARNDVKALTDMITELSTDVVSVKTR